MSWHFTKARRITKRRKLSPEAQAILDRLGKYLEDNSAEPVEILCGFWKDQQDAITYQELRKLVEEGYLDEVTARLWEQDYSVLVKERMPKIWNHAIIAGAASQPLMERTLGAWTFNSQTPGVIRWIQSRGAEMVTVSTQTQKDAIALLLEDKMRNAHTVDELARLIRPCVGLYRQQASAVSNYYDSLIKALTEQHPRTRPARIRALALDKATKYAERLHRQRAMMIAQTEMAFAYNYGADEGIRQAQADFLIGRCEKRWCTSGDDNVCTDCAELDGKQIGMEERFYSGNTRYEESGLYPPLHPRCACAVQYIEMEAPNPPKDGRDVTKEYLDGATPGKGTISKEPGYNEAKYQDEVQMANWLHDTLGGNITLLNESDVVGQKRPDYLWRDKLWDLKTTSTAKAADAAVRKGLKQIKDNPGGIILNYGERDISLSDVRNVISNRMKFSGHQVVDVMVISKGQSFVVFRYAK